jgi:hypothetical protein
VGPEGKVNRNFGSRGLERKASLKASWTENPKSRSPEISEDRRIVADFKDNNYVVGPENKETDFSEFGN